MHILQELDTTGQQAWWNIFKSIGGKLQGKSRPLVVGKVIIDKSRSEASLLEQDIIENIS